MKKFFVKSDLPHDILEPKPGIGEFRIPAGAKIEFPEDLAIAIVTDFGREGLELVVEEVLPPSPSPSPKLKTVNKGIISGKRKKNKSVS